MTAIPPSPPRPISPEFNTPFFRVMKSESILNEGEELTDEQKAATEKFLKDQEEQHRNNFIKAARLRQFANVYKGEVKTKKG